MTTYIIMSSWTSPYPWGILESLGKSRNWHLLTMRQYNIFPWIGTGSNSKIWDWKLLEWHKHKQLSSSVWSIPHIIGSYSHLDRSSAGQSPAEPRRVSFLPLYHETRLRMVWSADPLLSSLFSCWLITWSRPWSVEQSLYVCAPNLCAPDVCEYNLSQFIVVEIHLIWFHCAIIVFWPHFHFFGHICNPNVR